MSISLHFSNLGRMEMETLLLPIPRRAGAFHNQMACCQSHGLHLLHLGHPQSRRKHTLW